MNDFMAGVVRAAAEQLPRGDRSTGSVLALNLFQHVERFWRGPFAPYLDAECFDTQLIRAA